MGGVACVIIIQCGALKAKAAELFEAVPKLRPQAAELEALEGEICDLGPEIAEYLDAAERAEVVSRGDEAWNFGVRIQSFIDDGSRSHEDIDALSREISAFCGTQAAFFRALAKKYKDE
jgi:hypothetical protein